VQRYPELAMVHFCRPSETKKGQHRRWLGFLREINLDDHVRFLDVPAAAADGLDDGLIEQYHDIWFEDPEKPPWLFVVVNGKHALFVFAHVITDGRGATQVHGSLLEALNLGMGLDRDESPIVRVSPDDVPGFPEPDPITRSGASVSIPSAISMFFIVIFTRLVYRFTDAFFHDSYAQPISKPLTFSNPNKESHHVKTQTRTLRLKPATVNKCIDACHAHQTTFTSLLHTLVKVTLAADFYPTSRFSHSQIALDIRPYLLPHARAQTMSTAVSIVTSFDWLARFREAGTATAAANADLLIWDIAREHRAYIVKDLNHTHFWRKAWLTVSLLGEDEEDYTSQFLPGYRNSQRNCFFVSNLGAFAPSHHHHSPLGGWTISNMEFSAGAIKAGYGANLSFDVTGVAGGDTVIHVSAEKGSFRDGFVSSLLERIQKRLEAII
jgi:hypothetical protein